YTMLAEVLAQETYALAHRDKGTRAEAALHLGNIARNRGDVPSAIRRFQESRDLSIEIGDRRGEENALGSLGNAFFSLGEYQQATGYYQRALAIAREIGDRQGEGTAL